MDRLRFGTAGIPLSTVGGTIEGVKRVRELGLESMELEFVHSINLNEEKAKEVQKVAKKNDVVLSAHGQYYINLNSNEKAKIEASKMRIYQAAVRAYQAGAFSLTFHAAFYMKTDPEKVYKVVKEGVEEVIEKLKDDGIKIWIRPETTGKSTQWGSLKEIVRLSEEVDQVLPCVDFAHLHARSGKDNTYEEFKQNLALIENKLGKKALSDMHMHIAGIEYTEKGERRHLTLKNSDMNYKDLIKVFKEFKVKGSLISESPNIEEDALLLKKEYEK
jgi:deoxyribonuclease IV